MQDDGGSISWCPSSPLPLSRRPLAEAVAAALLTPPTSARCFQEAERKERRAGEGWELFCTGGGPCFFHPYQRGRKKPQEGIPKEEVIPFSSTQREGASCLQHTALQLPGWQGHSKTQCPHLPALKVLKTPSGLGKVHLCLQALVVWAGDTHVWVPAWPGTLAFGAWTLPSAFTFVFWAGQGSTDALMPKSDRAWCATSGLLPFVPLFAKKHVVPCTSSITGMEDGGEDGGDAGRDNAGGGRGQATPPRQQ